MLSGNDPVKYPIYKYLTKEGTWIYTLIVLHFSGLNNLSFCFKKASLVHKGGSRLSTPITTSCNLVRKGIYIVHFYIENRNTPPFDTDLSPVLHVLLNNHAWYIRVMYHYCTIPDKLDTYCLRNESTFRYENQ